MSERTLPRPPQVTFSGWVILVGSLVVLSTVYDTVANLRSIDTREEVEQMLSEPPLSGTGVGLQRMLDMMHGAALVAGACAAAMAVMGAFVLRRHHQARVVVSILAVPLFVCGLLVGGFATSLVAVAAVLLWTRPARDWFAGRAPAPAPAAAAEGRSQWPDRPVPPPSGRSDGDDEPGEPTDSVMPTPSLQPGGTSSEEARAWTGFGTPRQPTPREGSKRPREVISAAVLVWVFAGFALVTTLTALVVVPGDDALLRDLYEDDDRFAQANVSFAALKTMVLVLSAGIALWALVAVVLAVFAFLRHNWARWILFASSVVTAVSSLLLVIGAPMMLVLTGAAVYVAVLLTRPNVTAWYSTKDARH